MLCRFGCTLRGARVTVVMVNSLTELVVVVSVRKLSSCPYCGRSCRDLEVSGRLAVLLWIKQTSQEWWLLRSRSDNQDPNSSA